MSHLARRHFLATAGAGVATLALAPLNNLVAQGKKAPAFTLPKLPYAYDALEPTIDAMTMTIHHTKHHQAYITGLNAAIKDEPSLAGKSVSEMLANNARDVPAAVRQRVI